MRRLIRDISSVLIISGLLLLLDAGVTLVWQEPVTAAIGLVMRSEINKRYLSYRTAPLSLIDQHALAAVCRSRRAADRVPGPPRAAPGRDRRRDRARSRSPRSAPATTIVQGTDTASLEKGPGHYPATALPGLGQTVAIAGHRTTYLAPFRHINALAPGDQIVVTMPYGRFTYVVQYHRIVLPTASWVTDNVGYERLVLSACNPLYSAAQRIIVFARLKAVKPLGPA